MGAGGWEPGTRYEGRVPDNPNNLLLLYFTKDKNAFDLMNNICLHSDERLQRRTCCSGIHTEQYIF